MRKNYRKLAAVAAFDSWPNRKFIDFWRIRSEIQKLQYKLFTPKFSPCYTTETTS
uniref:Uncharacterized protein n=1 Tax=Romanomermis culicivorax TaxID=13658 RepID=A0A915KG37_ROMCU